MFPAQARCTPYMGLRAPEGYPEVMATKQASILVVDPEPKVRAHFSRVLEARGWKLVVLERTDAALKLCEKGAFEFAFVDAGAKGALNALELARRLQETECVRRTVLMSYDHEHGAEMERAGLGPVLTKPFQPEILHLLCGDPPRNPAN